MNVLVIGASRGIGLEFARQFIAEGAQVSATARDEAGLERLREIGATAFMLDVTDATSASGLAAQLEGAKFDVAIVNAGAGGPRSGGLEAPSEADFDHVMRTNVLGPMRVIPQIAESLAPGGTIAVLSSVMGSIGSRTGAGMSPYRASKSAVNSVLKDAALVLGDKAVCVALHPGWVRTDMGGSGADIDVATSVTGMKNVLAGLKPKDNGAFVDYQGKAIPW